MTPDESFGLLYPFVVVTSKGGPYDDAAFVAGCRFQQVAEVLRREKPPTHSSYEYPNMLPQFDLLAMHEGYTLTSEPWDECPDEWVYIKFTRAPYSDIGRVPQSDEQERVERG